MKTQEIIGARGAGVFCMRIWQGRKKGLPNLGYKMMVSKGRLRGGLEEEIGTLVLNSKQMLWRSREKQGRPAPSPWSGCLAPACTVCC